MKKGRNSKKTNAGRLNDFFPIVAIGASAGGIEAVTELFKNLPSDTGMAYVYIQHLDPTHKSLLPDLLARTTKMKVEEARHLLSMEPDHVYIIPPNQDMIVEDGVLTLNKRKAKPALHLPIDKFFTSIAEKQKSGAIGVLLSGSASDGTMGLRAIKMAGGLTFAQDDSAKFQSMPKSAITEGVVDLVLPPKKIAQELSRISKQSLAVQFDLEDFSENDNATRDEDLMDIIQLLKKSLGIDFTHYKINTIKRRIVRRMLLYKLETLKAYYSYLRQHTSEINVLYQDLLINVTSFFRDPDGLEYFKKTLLPRLLKSKSDTNPLRIWVPACSTGEEAYSLAMIMLEVLGDKVSNIPVQLFATDLSELAIAKARLGLYSRNEVLDVSPKRLQRFFTKIDGGYRVVKLVRDLCIFAPHNIFRDPPFSRLDFISCCNLMIYMDSVLQKKMIATFHYALNPEGYLMLGKSETVSASPQFFLQVEKKYKIYARKKEANRATQFEISNRSLKPERVENLLLSKRPQKDRSRETNLDKAVDTLLLTHYVPASVVVNSDLEILQFRGESGLFLDPAPGKASLNILKMARSGLAFELRTAVHKANKSGKTIRKTGLEIERQGRLQKLSIEVVPLKSDNDEHFFLVLFEELAAGTVPAIKSSLTKDKLVKKLEAELRNAKEDMRTIITELEATNEDLQSANEEVVSSNEELQSINEELETSKEEIESNNEELMTINSELQIRNDQLTESHEYSEAVLDIIREAVLVLDKDLRVKYANKAFYKIFQVEESETEGVYVYELGDRQWNIPKLKELLDDVIQRNAQFQGFEVEHIFRKIGKKIMLLHARSIIQKTPKQQLILLAIEDISDHRQGQKIISEREAWLRHVTDNLPVMIWVVDTDKKCTFLNNTWLEFTGEKTYQGLELDWMNIVHPGDQENFQRKYDEGFRTRRPYTLEYRAHRKDGEYRWMFLSASPNYSGGTEFLGFIGSVTDVHNQRMFVEQLEQNVEQRTHAVQEANKNLEQSNEELRQFAYVASHDLQEPLRKITTFANLVTQRHQENDMRDMQLYLRKIVESSKRMSRLINDLLNFSRSTRNSRDFSKIDLSVVVADILGDFDLTAHKIDLRIEIEKLTIIDAIPIQMIQLFHNLLSNAIKFSANNPNPVVKVSCRRLKKDEVPLSLDTERKYLEIKISDNGIGFNQQFADQIFVIFQRLHDKQTFPGTGIGLALCKKIVSNHDGMIFAESSSGEGANFFVILPLTQNPSNR